VVEADQKNIPNTLVKVYDLILTFDTDVKNSEISKEVDCIIDKINTILSRELKNSLPYIFKQYGKEAKISVSFNKDED
jgi:hypothetical protein